MRRTAILTLTLALFATAAVAADDRVSIEEQTLAHLEASNAALDKASAAVDANNIPGTCPHLKTAGEELTIAGGLLDRYRQIILEDSSLTAGDRDAQISELKGLQTDLEQQASDIDDLLAEYCA